MICRAGANACVLLITPTFVAEISSGLHFQRNNDIPRSTDQPVIFDNFAVLRNGTVLTPTQTGNTTTANDNGTGFVDYVDGRGGSLQRRFFRGPGFNFVFPWKDGLFFEM